MTKLEEKLLAQIRARLEGLDVRASDKLAALLPALRKLTEGYAALGAAAKKTLAGLIPELAALIEVVLADTGASTKKDMGRVMGELTKRTGGNFDKAGAAKILGGKLS